MAPISRILGSLWAAALLVRQTLLVQARPANTTAVESVVEQDEGVNVNVLALNTARPRPFYAIAHRVISDYCVREALGDGANALEMDVQPWSDQWYADHDGTLFSKGHSVQRMFETVAERRHAGYNVTFVWLDIKNPDHCDASEPHCNIEALRRLARAILKPAGVKVLYGFYNGQGRAYHVICDGLDDNEAINVDGNAADVESMFDTGGPANISKRIMSKGLFYPMFNFGDCNGDSHGICPQLHKAVASGAFGKVFGWTINGAHETEAGRLMSEAGVDGLIYGTMASQYRSGQGTRVPLSFITEWVQRNPGKRYLATVNDKPW